MSEYRTAETIALLQSIVEDADRTAKLIKSAEWLYSGDTGEDDFAAYLLRMFVEQR